MHSQGFIVTQDIMPDDDEDYNIKELAANNDYLFLMAYDEHYVQQRSRAGKQPEMD